jgi:hypothetical protein
MTEPEVGFSGALHAFGGDAARGIPLELYALFRRPPDPQHGHLAMRGLRTPDDALYAKPSGQGVEYQRWPFGSGGLKRFVDADGLIVAFEWDVDRSFLVFGLVADHVQSVEVVVEGRSSQARLENNAYALLTEAEPDESQNVPFSVVLHRQDGTTARI